jgi:hypothetical protein
MTDTLRVRRRVPPGTALLAVAAVVLVSSDVLAPLIGLALTALAGKAEPVP